MGSCIARNIEELQPLLVPKYIRTLPTADGWNHPLRVSSDGTTYELVSPGKDGVYRGCRGGTTDRFDDDICFADGMFTQYPEGAQR